MADPGKLFDLDAARGMLVGLAVGDAVGTTVEFAPRGSFPPVTDMRGGGPFRLAPGQWTDDTSMALCLGDSLLAQDGWDPDDCMRRFVNWRDHGYNSATGICFDIGNQTNAALDRFLAHGDPYAGPLAEDRSGNGGIMRLAPAVIAYGFDTAQAERCAILQSRTTHASETCLHAARQMTAQLLGADMPAPVAPPDESSGYVVHSLHAAHWAIARTADFESAILAAVNLGGDADTAGAITGQLAGRIYGYRGIPDRWRTRLYDHDRILALADALWHLKPTPIAKDT